MKKFAGTPLLLLAVAFLAASLHESVSAGKKEETFQRITAVTHIHSLISPRGTVSLDAIAAIAARKGIDVLIPTDHFSERWEYGLEPFPGILRRTIAQSSVLKFGPGAYLRILEKVQKEHPGLLVIPGLEVTPAYRWTGNPLEKNLVLHDSQRHMLVIGLTNGSDMASLPVLSNPQAGEFRWRKLVFPLFLTALGLSLMIRWPAGLLLAALGIFWGVNQRPWRQLPDAFTQYARNGYDADQSLIDAVNARGGLVVWAHPESKSWGTPQSVARGVSIETAPYPEALLETKNYAGFGYYWEGANTVGGIGGTWDQALLEFARGKRPAPAWAFGELDWTAEGRLGVSLDDLRNVLWVREKSIAEAMEALRKGRFYMYFKLPKDATVLKTWEIESGGERLLSGETGTYSGRPRLNLAVESPPGDAPVETQLIRNGALWKTFKDPPTFRRSLELAEAPADGSLDYFRAVLRKGGVLIVTNPIFLRREGKILSPESAKI